MLRAVHNSLLLGEEDFSDFESDISAFNVAVRKSKTFRTRNNYFEFFDEEEFVKIFRLKKTTVERVLNEIVDEITYPTNR